MSQKTALKTIAILVLISLLAIGGNAILVRAFPDKFGQEVHQSADLESSPDLLKADELPINEMEIDQTSKNNRNVWAWPYDSAVPVYHTANLDIYQDRAKDESTLEGITVYLSLDPIEIMPTMKENSQANDQDSPEENTEDGSDDQEIATIPNVLINEQDLQDVLENILNYTKESLESLGAEVILLDFAYYSDMQKAAFVGQDIIEDFKDELSEQNFKSERLSELLGPLKDIKNSPDNLEVVNQFFPQIGVSADQRLLLDVERQYTDRLFINLKYGNSEDDEITGSLVQYLGNESAAIGAQTDTISQDSLEKPAYLGYATDDRLRFSELMEKNISQLIPGLSYSGNSGSQEKLIPSLRLINLNSLEIEIGQKNHNFDLQILNSTEQQKVFAEAISNATYEFYCTDLK